jgi:hypothetical protein
MLRDCLETVVEQDGDPELFERFLKVDLQFTLKDVEKQNQVKCNLRIGKAISMSTEDTCKEVSSK